MIIINNDNNTNTNNNNMRLTSTFESGFQNAVILLLVNHQDHFASSIILLQLTICFYSCDGFLCHDGQCISSSWRCDNVYDCNSREDEENCGTTLLPPHSESMTSPTPQGGK